MKHCGFVGQFGTCTYLHRNGPNLYGDELQVVLLSRRHFRVAEKLVGMETWQEHYSEHHRWSKESDFKGTVATSEGLKSQQSRASNLIREVRHASAETPSAISEYAVTPLIEESILIKRTLLKVESSERSPGVGGQTHPPQPRYPRI